jgi:hypothetical protein
MVTPTNPITATPMPENISVLQTILTITVQTMVPQPKWSSSPIYSKLTRRSSTHEPTPSRSTASGGQLNATTSLLASKQPSMPNRPSYNDAWPH